MRVVEVVSRPSNGEIARISEFVESLTVALGARPLSDHLWLDLQAGGAAGFVGVAISDDDGLIAYAQISAGNDASSLEAFADPSAADATTLRDDAAETALDAFAAAGGGRLYWWVDDPDDADRAFADDNDFIAERALFEMRRQLPHERRASVETRSFRPGSDDDAWLQVNNRAFADHGEQGGWTSDTLALRQREDWFDPDGFRLHDIDGRLAAFCWTKLHRELDPVVGEIYVIAVDPDFHGRGLGKQLTLAGLDSIADRGVTTANLYVDAGNAAAVNLYDTLGFTVHRRREAFTTTR